MAPQSPRGISRALLAVPQAMPIQTNAKELLLARMMANTCSSPVFVATSIMIHGDTGAKRLPEWSTPNAVMPALTKAEHSLADPQQISSSTILEGTC